MYVFNRYYGKWWHAMNLVNAPPTRVMKINFHIRESFLILIFLNLKERSLKVLNLKKHGLEHCYNSSRLFSNDSFPYHSHKDNLLQLFIIIAIGGQLTRSNFFLRNLEGTSKKMECLFKWPFKKKKSNPFFKMPTFFSFIFFLMKRI